MRARARIVLLATTALAVLPACQEVDDLLGRGPKAALTGYLDATIRADWEAAYEYLSSQDQAIRTLAEYEADLEHALAKAIAEKTEYSIVSIQRTGDTAQATVNSTVPDISGMFADVLGGAFASALGGAKQEEIEKNLAEKYSSGDLPTTTKSQKFTLLRESQGWRVFLNWETEEKVSTLLSEAKVLKEQKKLGVALDKYAQVLELDSELIEAKEGHTETEKEIHEFEEKQQYIRNVVLYDLEARYYETYLDKRVPGVEFKIKNKGDRTLKKVEVTVYFKDASGTVIAEEDYHPVLVRKYSFGDNKPLKPDYVWQLERGKFYKAEAVPTEWKEGSVSAKITDIEFTE